jgi:hypothetical protein
MIAAAAAAAILPMQDSSVKDKGHDHKSQSNGNLKRDDNNTSSLSPLPPPPSSPANPPSHKDSDHRQSAASSSISPMSCSVSLPIPPPASILSSSSCLQVQQLWFTGSGPIAHNPHYSLGTVSCHALQCALQNPYLGLQTLCLKGTQLDPPGLQALCSGLATSTCLTSLRLVPFMPIMSDPVGHQPWPPMPNCENWSWLVVNCYQYPCRRHRRRRNKILRPWQHPPPLPQLPQQQVGPG